MQRDRAHTTFSKNAFAFQVSTSDRAGSIPTLLEGPQGACCAELSRNSAMIADIYGYIWLCIVMTCLANVLWLLYF